MKPHSEKLTIGGRPKLDGQRPENIDRKRPPPSSPPPSRYPDGEILTPLQHLTPPLAGAEWAKELLSMKIDADACLEVIRKGPNGASLETYGLDQALTKKLVEKLYWDMWRHRGAKYQSGPATAPRARKWTVCGAPPFSWVGETKKTRVYDFIGMHMQEYPLNKTPMAKAANARCRRRKGHEGMCRNSRRMWEAAKGSK